MQIGGWTYLFLIQPDDIVQVGGQVGHHQIKHPVETEAGNYDGPHVTGTYNPSPWYVGELSRKSNMYQLRIGLGLFDYGEIFSKSPKFLSPSIFMDEIFRHQIFSSPKFSI